LTKYLRDTNHASRLMGNDDRIVSRVRQARQTGDEFGIPMTILGELFFAVYASQRQMQNLQRLSRLLPLYTFTPLIARRPKRLAEFRLSKKPKAVQFLLLMLKLPLSPGSRGSLS